MNEKVEIDYVELHFKVKKGNSVSNAVRYSAGYEIIFLILNYLFTYGISQNNMAHACLERE